MQSGVFARGERNHETTSGEKRCILSERQGKEKRRRVTGIKKGGNRTRFGAIATFKPISAVACAATLLSNESGSPPF
jgi:hypothetical protein